MNVRNRLALTILMAAVAAGCSKKPETPVPSVGEVSSPACAALATEKDPAKRAELMERCPRKGQFKPSSNKSW